ncbi:MAG: hypothetical protein ACRDN8_20290 [Thermoleophilaceae bacterium]
MGVLDDAIRQHLELKRQHGAPEEEIERQEEEALGPARRDVAPADDAGGELEAPEGAEGAPAAEAAAATEADSPAGTAPVAHEQETVLHEPESEVLAEPEAPVEPEPLPETEPELFAEPEPAPPAEPDPPAPYDGGADLPGVDEDVEPEHEEADEEEPGEAEPDAADADVLEDTPDFLQETPEHDRLWFEQKPPRDFDFD